MANFVLGTPNAPSQLANGGLPSLLDITGWNSSPMLNGLLLTPPVFGPPRPTNELLLVLDANNNITSIDFRYPYIHSTLPGFVATGLSIPLAAFLAASSDVMPLVLAGNDTIHGNNFADRIDGQAGNDQIWGGNGEDFLFGGAGNDTLYGGAGFDQLFGGAGDDVLAPGKTVAMSGSTETVDGGLGADTVSFSELTTGVSVNLTTGRAGEAVNGSNFIIVSANLVSIENAAGGSGNDVLTGNASANTLSGGIGADLLYGGAGNDKLYGEDGNDILRGDAGADVINGGLGIDRADYTTSTIGVTVNLTAGTASDGDALTGIENLYGSALNDTLSGNAGGNALYGSGGNDQLFGLLGNDRLEGQTGDDAVFGGEGNDVAGGGDGNDGLFGEGGSDALYGGNGNDYLSGGDGNDVIWGDAGNDQIDAGAGNDFVVLGAGSDDFTLGLGDDRVRFDYGNGIDTIRDFGLGNDVIDFSATNMTLAALQANAVQTAAGVLMSLGGGSILLEGVQLSQIDWAVDFVFAL